MQSNQRQRQYSNVQIKCTCHMKGLHNTASRANRTWWRCAATLAACLVATGANAAVPQQKEASQKSCGTGWDQLLAPAQREEAARERGCDVRLVAAPVPQAEQLAAYERTLFNGPSATSPASSCRVASRRHMAVTASGSGPPYWPECRAWQIA